MTTPRKVGLLVAAAALLAAAIVLLLLSLRSSAPTPYRPHYALNVDHHSAKDMDRRSAPLLAQLRAPQAGTHCETAYNGFAAGYAANPREMMAPPARDVFLERCSHLTVQEQQCLWPRYATQHGDICKPLYRDVLPQLFDAPPNAH